MKIKNFVKGCLITILVMIIIIILLALFLMDYFLIYPPAEDFVSETFSIVINNTTDETMKDIDISYGGYDGNPPEAFLFSTIDSISPGQYIKVIIPTDNPSESAGRPYNVFISLNYSGKRVVEPVGYFETNTGGFAAVDIIENDNEIDLEPLVKSSRKYHRLYWKHRRHQWELSW